MSRSNSKYPQERYSFRDARTLWQDDDSYTTSLGCQSCALKSTCGGLSVAAPTFDCLSLCRCTDPSSCDNVCPKNVQRYVARMREISGFGLENVPRAPVSDNAPLPGVIPMIFHKSGRHRPPTASHVALSLYQLLDRRGSPKFATGAELREHFRLSPETRIVLSGTDADPPLERWWNNPHRETVIDSIATLGIELVTTPNFSLFDDVPRPDNLHSMKRIAITWSEFQRHGLRCALHVNARTGRDWNRWSDFLKYYKEIGDIAFEFGTGAGWGQRTPWHVGHLKALATSVGRPLNLLMRGGLHEITGLRTTYQSVSLLDTSSFMRAQKRQRASVFDGRLSWASVLTATGEGIDDTLDANVEAIGTITTCNPSEIRRPDQSGTRRSQQSLSPATAAQAALPSEMGMLHLS